MLDKNRKIDKKVYDLRERTFRFARRILEIVAMLPRTTECEVIRKQMASSGTSIGANVEEADGSLSKRDFVNKMGIARKEAKECKYWLRVVSGKYLEREMIAEDIRENGEIISILSSIITKARAASSKR